MTTLSEPDPIALATAWAAADPDSDTRANTEAMLVEGGEELRRRFGSRLEFGTAGLRGQLGAGPMRMNRVLVRVVAAAIAARVGGETDPHVVIGLDARHKSSDFATDTARVCATLGVRATLLPRPLPTPVLAFAVTHLRASAGVMVTASHNPRSDNGYKVFWSHGAQITPPIDTEISDLINSTALLSDSDLAAADDPLIATADDSLLDAYFETVLGLLTPNSERTAKVAYTPLHGVGAETFKTAFQRAGFDAPQVVADQAAPDPDFPTTPFPNPEETGVLDRLFALATEVRADVALANDPDADRLAVAVPNGPTWKLLTGDEVGCLLAEYLLRRPSQKGRLVLNTVVSSRLLAAIAQHHGAEYVETLTGFKWIMDARRQRPTQAFVMGYEEALGYTVGDAVSDKDGISAALLITELVGELAAQGQTLLDLLDELHRRHGVHSTGQRSIRFEATEDEPVMVTSMAALRQRPPTSLAGRSVTGLTDLALGSETLAATDGIVLDMEGARVVVRPSGTEPKMKVYGEVVVAAGDNVVEARLEARAALKGILDAAVTVVASPETLAFPSSDHELTDRAAEVFADLPTGAARADDLRLIVLCVDLTTLEGNDTPGRIRALCAQARRPDPADPTVGPVAAVCVYPSLVPIAAELTRGSSVKVASVAGAFPSGLSALDVRLADIADAVGHGAHEVDIVLNRSAFLSGAHEQVGAEVRASRAAAGDAHLKVILEVGELGSITAVRAAADLAIAGGAQTIKTSTGKTSANATPAAVLAMAEQIAKHHERTGEAVGIKIAGGVRTADDALGYVAIVRAVLGEEWLTPERLRFGASSLLTALLADLTATEAGLR